MSSNDPNDPTLAAWLAVAGFAAKLPGDLVPVARARIAWMVPVAQAFLARLLADGGDRVIQRPPEPDLLGIRWPNDVNAPCPAVAPIAVRQMHGHLESSPFACASAIPLLPSIEQAHLILLAAGLAMAAVTKDPGSRWYQFGLTLRKLAEPTRAGEAGYTAPSDLAEVHAIDTLLARLGRDADEEAGYEVFIATDMEAKYLQGLHHLQGLLSAWYQPWRRRGAPGSQGNAGMRGPGSDLLPRGMQWRPARALGGMDDDVTQTWRIAEVIEMPEGTEQSDSADDPEALADAGAILEQVFPPSVPREEQREAIQRVLACQVAGVEPDFELDEEPEDVYAAIRRVDAEALKDWRRAVRALPRPARRWAWVGLIITVVLGVHPDRLRHLPLRLAGAQRLPGLHLWRDEVGDIHGTLAEPITPLHQPFAPSHCAPEAIDLSSDLRVIRLHPVIARWLAVLLQSLGAVWTPKGLRAPPGRWRPTKHLEASRAHVRRGPGLPEPLLVHLGGIHLGAMRAGGVHDPAVMRLLAPTLVNRTVPAMHYTRAGMSALQTQAETVQVTAWTWLTRRPLSTPKIEGAPEAVGSLRCATRSAIGEADRILTDAARRAGVCIVDAETAAAWVNAAVDRFVFKFTVRFGLRARGPLWGPNLELCAANDYWSILDKGQHRRTLPLDAPEQALVQELAGIFTKAAHPALGTAMVETLHQAARQLTLGQEHGAKLTLGHLIREDHGWQWTPLTIAAIEARLARGGRIFTLQALRHWARSTLVRLGAKPESIGLLLGHHGFAQEEFRPFRHTCGPLLRVLLIPLVRRLASEAGV